MVICYMAADISSLFIATTLLMSFNKNEHLMYLDFTVIAHSRPSHLPFSDCGLSLSHS